MGRNIISINSLLITITTLFSVLGIFISVIGDDIRFWNIGVIEIISLCSYVFLMVLVKIKPSLLSIVLPFIIIAFPTPVSHFIFGINSQKLDNGVILPFFNHVELFLLYVLITFRTRKKYVLEKPVIFICVGILFSFLVGLFYCKSTQEVSLLTTGLYVVRVLILVSFLLSSVNIVFERFLKGVIFSILFLLIESVINTRLLGVSELTSGSLGINTYGNIMGQLVCFLIYSYVFCNSISLNKRMVFFAVLIGILIVLWTSTRMAILAMGVIFLIVIFPMMSLKSRSVFILIFFAIVFVLGDYVISILQENEKFDFNAIVEMVKSRGDVARTASTSSIFTRLDLWTTSFNMIANRPFSGIGLNMFDYLKEAFGFSIDVVIDPHCGYLYLLSSLGIVFGMAFIYFLYIQPWRLYYKTKNSTIKSMCVINMGMSVCEMTNAGVFKYQILTLLIFATLYAHDMYRKDLQSVTIK